MRLRRRSILSFAVRLFLPAIILLPGAFLLSGCKVAVLDQVTFTCDATGMASATFQWTPIGREDGTQYLDLSSDSSFPGGLFVGAGPFPSDQQSYSWNGLPAGETSYWRVNTLIDGAWYTSATGTLTTPCVQERSQYLLAKGINGMRSADGLPPLTLDSRLTTIANGRAQDMANNDYFSHYPPDGCNLGCLLQKSGVDIMDWGEIIARNNYPGVDEEVSVALDGWRNSPGHFAIITDKSYRSLGVGFALDATGTSYEVGVFEAEETTTPPAASTKSPTPNATPTPIPTGTATPTPTNGGN
jgi:hypothetical protein